jgi:predicted ATP-grasp superfamily ATP-dependent carboligase
MPKRKLKLNERGLLNEYDVLSLLVTGIDVVALCASAIRAGYQVYAADYFGDQDLKHLSHKSQSLCSQDRGKSCGRLTTKFNPRALLPIIEDFQRSYKINAALLSSGLDDNQDVLLELNDLIPILGNHPNIIQSARDKTRFFQELKRLGISNPETSIAEDFKEAKEKSKDIGYPVMVKPSRGFGGMGIRKAWNFKELKEAYRVASFFDDEILIQEYISGTPTSVSLISSATTAFSLTVNEQLLGIHEFGQLEPFGYCGNVVPHLAGEPVIQECRRVAERVALHFGLIGSNGVDLVISEEGVPYVVEVNPRFQGTLECVERISGINVVDAHVKACRRGALPTFVNSPTRFCVRLILFASERSIVPDLSAFEGVRNIPYEGVVVEKGEPVCSVIAEGTTRSAAIREGRATIELIRTALKIFN